MRTQRSPGAGSSSGMSSSLILRAFESVGGVAGSIVEEALSASCSSACATGEAKTPRASSAEKISRINGTCALPEVKPGAIVVEVLRPGQSESEGRGQKP